MSDEREPLWSDERIAKVTHKTYVVADVMAVIPIELMRNLITAVRDDYEARIADLEARLAQTPTIPPDVRERLADYAHEAWSGWMRYMFSKGMNTLQADDNGTPVTFWTMEPKLYDRWTRQMNTPYAELPESEKASDRKEADEILAITGDCEAQLAPVRSDAPSPDRVAERMAAFAELDAEDRHMQGDALLCDTLRALGYGNAADEFERWMKWYA